ncbi:hypothetical protein PENARI_c239G05377, partial [Penicillium arizonense]
KIRQAYLWGPDPGTGRDWSSERLREVLKRETTIGLNGQAINLNAYRDIAIGISRRFMRPSSAAHSSHVAGMIYGRGITEQPGFVSTDDGGAESALGLAQFSPWQKEAEIGQPEMQRMIGGNSELRLRGVQAPALEAIQQGQSPVVAVMPTGGGKSLLFMLPAWISPRGVTVVVVPLIALRGDIMHRCRQLGILCVAWESRRPADQASIVLVTPESAITEDFMTFLNRQRLCHRLDRIVIDECHVRGLEDRHDLYECRAQTQYGNDSPKGWWLRVRRQVKYAAFGGYY